MAVRIESVSNHSTQLATPTCCKVDHYENRPYWVTKDNEIRTLNEWLRDKIIIISRIEKLSFK